MFLKMRRSNEKTKTCVNCGEARERRRGADMVSQKLLWSVLVFLSLCSQAFATDRYVDQGCSNGNGYVPATRACSGGTALVYATGQACANAAIAGDTCLVRGGTYNVSVGNTFITSAASGNSSNPIIFKAYPGETPIISLPIDNNDPDTFGFIILSNHDIIIDGFTIIGGANGIVTYGGTNGIQALNNTVSFQYGTGIIFYGGSTNGIIRNNLVHDTNRVNWPRGNSNNWGAGITAGNGSGGTLIEDNVVYWNHGEGISCYYGSDDCIIRGNIVA